MQKNHAAKTNKKAAQKTSFAGTDSEKVKQEIQRDVNAGQGDITSREAGSYRD